MKPKAWIGIDPGLKGAAALLPRREVPQVQDWPGDPVAAADILRSWGLEYDILLVGLEFVHAMPKQGSSSTFKLGLNAGVWEGIVATLGLPCLKPRPRDWQAGLVKPSDGPDPKARSLAVARRLFPEAELGRKKDHGRADALLISWWASQQGR